MKRLILLVALVMAMAVLAPAAFADEPEVEEPEVEMEEKELSGAQQFKVDMIADYLVGGEASPADILYVEALRSGGASGHAMGLGVLFKLTAYAVAMDMSIEDVLELAPGDDGGYALGHLRKAYLEGPEDGDYLPLEHKNFGQLQKASKDKSDKPEKTMPPQANKDGKKHES